MVDAVPFTDIYMDEDTIERVADVLRSGQYVKGSKVEEFEDRFAAACTTDYAVGVSNGTAALLLAMKAVGVGAGDSVFVPAHTYFATVSPALELGAEPRFIDVNPERYTMEPEKLRKAVRSEPDPAAIVVTHMHGQPAEMDQIREVATEHDVPIIEDAAQAHLAMYRRETVGSIGDVGCFSFYPSKNMTVAGDGGMVVTDDDDIVETVRTLRNHGRNEASKHVELGLNYRLDETNAVVGIEQLSDLPDWNEGRRMVAERYRSRLEDLSFVELPPNPDDSTPVYHHYAIQILEGDRSSFRTYLEGRGIATGTHYSLAVHEHPAVTDRVGASQAPIAERYCRRTVSLPMHPRLSEPEIDHVCDAIEGYAP